MKRYIKLAGFAAAAELPHGHGTFIEMIHRNPFMTEIDRLGHAIGDLRRQVRVAKKSPAAEIDATNISFELGIMLAHEHGTGKPDLRHVTFRDAVDRQEAHF